jgi:CheY-like chemotaxis protein
MTRFRRQMEDRVRRSKRAGSACQFRNDEGQCTMLYIRCGDRLQYAMRESGDERRFYHQCTYDWRKRGSYVLIVDDDRNMLDFCKSSFQLFMRYDADKILTASSFLNAIDILARSKVEGKKIGLVIADIVMPGRSGYDLVNELYDRNFELEIVLMRAENESLPEPPGYKGSAEILPNLPFVSGTLAKPFHSDALVIEVKKLKFGW